MPNSNIERATRLILLRKLYLENQIHFSRWDRCTVEDIYCSYCPAGVLLECSINQALRNDIEHTSKITLGVVFSCCESQQPKQSEEQTVDISPELLQWCDTAHCRAWLQFPL
jgi:hypothetical protein